MRSNILLYLFMVGVLINGVNTEDEPTILTYYVEYEEDQDDDFIEVGLEIKVQSTSLSNAIGDAQTIADKLNSVGTKYCNNFLKKSKKKPKCKEVVQVNRFEAKPIFHTRRRDQVFDKFVVEHGATIAVYYPDAIGQLIDVLLEFPYLKMTGFEWLPFKEKDPQDEAIKQGLVEGKELCQRVGMSMGRILNVEEVLDDGEEEGEEEEEEPAITVYKFEVECLPKPAKKGKQ